MARRRLLVAHVLRGEAADTIDALRRAFGGPTGRIAPHLTLVPPLNVDSERIDEVLDHLDAVATTAAPVALRLDGPGTFAPVTPVLYVGVAGELAALRSLVARLESGPLAPPEGRASRPFVAHVTLSHRVEEARLSGAIASLGVLGIDIACERLVVLEQDESVERAWHELDDAMLGGRAVVGRGGRELAFESHELFGPRLAPFAPGGPVSAGRPLLVAARTPEGLVALAHGATDGDLAHLDGLDVVAAQRYEGIGTATLARFEDEAAARGARSVRARPDPFLAGRGYRELVTPSLVERTLGGGAPRSRSS